MRLFLTKIMMNKTNTKNLKNARDGIVASPFLSPGVHVPYQGGTSLLTAFARMNVIATHHQMQCLVMRII
jgi:hypothetical protein